jgi:hypothetical protein
MLSQAHQHEEKKQRYQTNQHMLHRFGQARSCASLKAYTKYKKEGEHLVAIDTMRDTV